MSKNRFNIEICDIEDCVFPNNVSLRKILREEIEENKLQDKAQVVKKGCTGHCAPFIVVSESGGTRFLYSELNEDKVKRIIREHIISNKPIKEWAVEL